jgi:hypothetical protein
MTLGPVPTGPDTMTGAVLLIGFGVVGFISLLLRAAKGKGVHWSKVAFLSAVLLFFIVCGLVELSRVR